MKSWIMRALLLAIVAVLATGPVAMAQESHPSANPNVAPAESANAAHPAEARTEANLILPDLSSVSFFGINGHNLLAAGLIVCLLGLVFGIIFYSQLKNLPVHKSM